MKRQGSEFRELMLQIFRTRMAFRKAMQTALRESCTDLTFEMLQVLSALWHEQGITQQVLAERTAKDKACLTNLMNNLEKRKYVCRREEPDDRRSKRVYLTHEGEKLREQIRPVLDRVYITAEHTLGKETVERILKDLDAVYETLENI